MSDIAVVQQFGSSDGLILFSEILFSAIWLIVLLVVIRTGATAARLGVYLGATAFSFLWDWIQAQDWFFRLTFDERLTPIFTLDGRAEPIFAPLAYGMFFGGVTVLAFSVRHWLQSRFGAWQFLVVGLFSGVLDILIEGGVAVTLLKLYVFDHDPAWEILNLPLTVIVYVVLMQTFLLYAVISLDRLLGAARSGNPAKEPLGLWWIYFLLPSGANYVAVALTALGLNLL